MIRTAAALAALLAMGAAAPDRRFEGRVAVATERCVANFGSQPLTILDDRTLVYAPVGKRIWRNDLPERCPGMDADDLLVIEPFTGTQYCEHDRIRPIERGSSFPGPVCRLGKFTAFEKAAR